MYSENVLQRKINYKLDDILNDYDPQLDLIGFDEGNFISIDYDLDKFSNLFKKDQTDFLEISFKDNISSNCINTNLSKVEFTEKYDELNNNRTNYIENNHMSNTYISLGLIKYNDYLGPCILIPIFFEKNHDSYKIYRNYSQEIQFNGIFKFIFDEENIETPEFDGNIDDFIKSLSKLDTIEFINNAYIGNFDLRFQHLFYDLNVNKWDSIQERAELFFKNDDSLIEYELNLLKNNLEDYAKSLDINDDILLLKSLLSKKNSILLITDNSTKDKIKDSFKMDNFDNFLLELSEDLSVNELYENIINSEIIQDEEIIELDQLVKKHEKCSEILKLINTNYSKFNISPKEIKTQKDNYAGQINGLAINNYIFDMKNVIKYDREICEGTEDQIKELLLIREDLFSLQANFSFEYLQSDDFNKLVRISKAIERHLNCFSILNTKLNRDYGVKIFDNLFSVNQLLDISVLNKNPILIEENDIALLNEYVKNYSSNGEYAEDANLNKYLELDDDIINSIGLNLKYTELINSGLISEDSIDLILDNFNNVLTSSKYLSEISYFILKELREIIEFYNNFKFFKINPDMDGNIENMKPLINTFKDNINTLLMFKKNYDGFNNLNDNLKNFIRFIYDNKISINGFSPVFWFNIYNSLLNNFLIDYNYIEEDKIPSEYEFEFKNLENELVYDKKQLLIQRIYSKPLELNKDEDAIKQKENLIKDYQDLKLYSIKNLLTNYKEYITANNRIFMMDVALISQLLDKSYENHFDWVIITQDLEYELDKLSLLLRSKNKIIQMVV